MWIVGLALCCLCWVGHARRTRAPSVGLQSGTIPEQASADLANSSKTKDVPEWKALGKLLHTLNPAAANTQPIVVQETSKVLKVSGKTIEGSGATIIGNNNRISGGFLEIIGDGNIVHGKHNVVKGNANLVQGINTVEGKGNLVRGMCNVVKGIHNEVHGMDNKLVELKVFNKKKFEKIQAKRSLQEDMQAVAEVYKARGHSRKLFGTLGAGAICAAAAYHAGVAELLQLLSKVPLLSSKDFRGGAAAIAHHAAVARQSVAHHTGAARQHVRNATAHVKALVRGSPPESKELPGQSGELPQPDSRDLHQWDPFEELANFTEY